MKPYSKMIDEIIKKPCDTLSHVEKLYLADYKYQQKQKISYDEYVMMLSENHEIYFCVNDTMYEVDHSVSDSVDMFIVEYDDKQKKSERCENFSSVIELLEQFRIDGKTIKEIWDKVNFD